MKLTRTIPLLLAFASSIHAFPQTAQTVRITGSTPAASGLNEERLIGETARPEWTSARRFPGTRVYIQKEPWEVGVESWWRVRRKRDGTVEHRWQEEIEIGLPYRMQLDIYGNLEGDNTGAFHFDNLAVELRWGARRLGRALGKSDALRRIQIRGRALESRRV